MNQHRALYRLPIDRVGKVSLEHKEAACRIIDLTQEGVRLETTLAVQAGERLRLSFELTPDTLLRCQVEVLSISTPYVGARFVDLSPRSRHSLITFVEDLLDINFGGM